MNQENNQLIKLSNQELSLNYQATLQDQYQKLKELKTQQAYSKYPEPGLLKSLTYGAQLEDQERKRLMQVSDQETLELALSSFQTQTKQLTIWASETIKNVIDQKDFVINNTVKKLTLTETSLMEQSNSNQDLLNQINQKNNEIERLKQTIINFQAKLAQVKARSDKYHYSNVSDSSKLIDSLEKHTINNFTDLQNKYHQLSENNLTQQELLSFKRSELKEYVKLAEHLDSQSSQLKSELADLETDWLSASLQLDQLTNENLSLQEKLENYQKQEQAWEHEKAQARLTLQKLDQLEQENIAKFQANALENAKLKAQIINLNDLIANGLKHIDSLNETLNKNTNELNQLKTELNRLEQLQKINLLGKAIKWTSRFCLPTAWASSIEIGIDAYELKQTLYPGSYELVWMIFGLITFFSLKKIFNYFFPAKPKIVKAVPANQNLVEKSPDNH